MVVWEMAAIVSRPQCVNGSWPVQQVDLILLSAKCRPFCFDLIVLVQLNPVVSLLWAAFFFDAIKEYFL